MKDLNQLISLAVKASGADDSIKTQLTEALNKELYSHVKLELLKTKLEVLYNFEKNYLELVKEYKEEISLPARYKKTYAKNVQNSSQKHSKKFLIH
ncbi:hypothetical protein ACGRSR_05920 [Vibrio owensii]|uniref:hypothetical protein n=1 Tax=Vibrio owensii TaxID=696485 RepID=UPI0037492D8C